MNLNFFNRDKRIEESSLLDIPVEVFCRNTLSLRTHSSTASRIKDNQSWINKMIDVIAEQFAILRAFFYILIPDQFHLAVR